MYFYHNKKIHNNYLKIQNELILKDVLWWCKRQQKTTLVFSSCGGIYKNKVFRSVEAFNYVFFSYKLPSPENNLSEYTKDNSAARYFLVKLARCVYFVLFKFHQFKTLLSWVSSFKFFVAKKPFILLKQYNAVALPSV